jgi:hypothetical protein
MAKKKTPSNAATDRRTATAPRRRTTAATQAEPRPQGSQGNGDPRRDPTPDEIAEAAYHRYLSRQAGQGIGSEFDDWVEAERELRSRKTR